MERSATLPIRPVRPRSHTKEQLNDSGMAFLGGPVKRGRPVVGGAIDLGPGPDQKLGHVGTPELGGPVQGVSERSNPGPRCRPHP